MRTLFIEYNTGKLVMYENVDKVEIVAHFFNKYLMWSSPTDSAYNNLDVIRKYWEEDL